MVHQPVSRGFAVFADVWLSGWLAEISADLRENGSALEVVLHDYALYKSTFTLLYFTFVAFGTPIAFGTLRMGSVFSTLGIIPSEFWYICCTSTFDTVVELVDQRDDSIDVVETTDQLGDKTTQVDMRIMLYSEYNSAVGELTQTVRQSEHCIYTYKTLRQQRTQNVQCRVQGTSSHIGEVASTNDSGRRPKLNGRRQSRRRTKESRRESSTSMSANCQRRSSRRGDQTDVRPPIQS